MFQTTFLRLLALFLLFLAPSDSRAAWPSDIQLIVTGNLSGMAATWADNGEITPAASWNVPELVRKLRREHHFSSLVIGVGNDANIHSPLTVAGGGSIERAWAKDAGIEIQALGPTDLAACKTAPTIPSDLLKRLWTNVATAEGDQVFPGWKRARVSNQSITVASFISSSSLTDIPLFRWRNLKIETPLHALHRMRAQAPDTDLKILICHLDADDLAQITAAAHTDELLLYVPAENSASSQTASITRPPTHPEMYELSDGNRSLLVIRRFARETGQTEVQVRRLPLANMNKTSPGPNLAAAISTISKALHRPLRVINTREHPDAPPYEPHPDAHARLIRLALQADIALVAIPGKTSWFRDRIITPLSIFSAFDNRRIRLYNLPGPIVHQLFLKFLHGSLSKRIGSDGIALTLPGRMPETLLINGRNLDERLIYKVAVSEDLFDELSVSPILGRNDLSGSRGMTLWAAWLNELPELPRSFELVK